MIIDSSSVKLSNANFWSDVSLVYVKCMDMSL